MNSELFRPDNFSQIDIRYKKTGDDPVIFKDILKLYFSAFEIKDIMQLDRPEINSQNFQILLALNGSDRRVLLRRNKILSELEQIDLYLDVLSILNKAGVTVSRVINSLNGARAVKINNEI